MMRMGDALVGILFFRDLLALLDTTKLKVLSVFPYLSCFSLFDAVVVLQMSESVVNPEHSTTYFLTCLH